MLYFGLDLNCAADICHPVRNSFAGGIDGHGQVGVRADHGASATDDVSSLRSALRGRTQSQNVFLPRSVSLHGVRAAWCPSRAPSTSWTRLHRLRTAASLARGRQLL